MNPFDVTGPNPLISMRASRFRWMELGEHNYTAVSVSAKPNVVALAPATLIVLNEIRASVHSIDLFEQSQGIGVSGRKRIYREFYAALVELMPEVKKIFKLTPDVFNFEFFPDLLGEYDRAPLSEQANMTLRLKDLTLKYETELGIPTKTLFETFNTDYNLARQTQSLATQSLTQEWASYKNILLRFKRQIWINILTIAVAFIDEPGMASIYIKPSVLRAYHKTRSGVPISKALRILLRSASIELADFAYVSTDKILLNVTGTESVFYFSTDVELTVLVVPDDATEVFPGREVLIEATNLKEFFYVANKSTDKEAKLELSLM
jgi:hypothetical protein